MRQIQLSVTIDNGEPRLIASGEWAGGPEQEAYEVADLMMDTARRIFREQGAPYYDSVPIDPLGPP